MTDKEIIEGNKLIMLFHGWERKIKHTLDPEHNGGKNDYIVYEKDGRSVREEDIPFDIVYHQSWDALMPVWKKVIEEIGVFMSTNYHEQLWHAFNDDVRHEMFCAVDVMKTFITISRIINWYNSQQNKTQQ